MPIIEQISGTFQTEIIATAIPNGRTQGDTNDMLHITLSLFPHLDKVSTDGHFSYDYYEIHTWYQYMRLFISDSMRVSFYDSNFNLLKQKTDPDSTPKDYPLTPVVQDTMRNMLFSEDGKTIPEKMQEAAIDLWHQMFPRGVNVDRWEHNPAYNLLTVLTQPAIQSELFSAIDDCVNDIEDEINELAKKHITVAERTRLRTSYSSFIMHLKRLKKKYKSTDKMSIMLTDPIFQDHNSEMFKKGFLKKLYSRLQKIYDSQLTELYELKNKIEEQKNTKPEDLKKINDYIEFHKLFSIYSYHPHLFELTGWLWQYNMDTPTAVKDHPGELLYVQIHILPVDEKTKEMKSKWAEKLTDTRILDFKSTHKSNATDHTSNFKDKWTAFFRNVHFRETLALTRSDKFLPLNKDDKGYNYEMDEFGYVKLHTDHYQVEPYLIDRKKVLQKVGDVVNKFLTGDADAQSRAEQEHAAGTKTGTEYVSTGITVAVHGLKEIVKQKIDNNPQQNKVDETHRDKTDVEILANSAGVLYAYNLQHGYLIDVISCSTKHQHSGSIDSLRYGSLCYRQEVYSNSTGKKFPFEPITEGIVIESLQLSNKNNIYVDDELFRWNDWHLTCPLPGEMQQEDNTNAPLRIAVKPPLIGETAKIEKLVPLRFGHKYSFGIRPCNIMGGAPPSIDMLVKTAKDTDTGIGLEEAKRVRVEERLDATRLINHLQGDVNLPFTKPILYQRVDAVNSPVVRTATRYRKDQVEVDDDIQNQQAAQNHPNQKNWIKGRQGEDLYNLVIRSIFDKEDGRLWPINDSSKRTIAPPAANLSFIMQHGVLDNLFKKANTQLEKRLLRNEILPLLTSKHNLTGVDDKEELYEEHNPIGHLYDPLADGYTFIVDGVMGKIKLDLAATEGQDKYWEKPNNHRKSYYPIVLLPAKQKDVNVEEPFSIDPKEKKCTIVLAQGNEKDILLGCAYNETFLGMPSDSLFMDGIRKINYTSFKVTHAVQKPCLIKEKNYTTPNVDLVYKNNSAEREGTIVGNLSYFSEDIYCRSLKMHERETKSNTIEVDVKFSEFPVLTTGRYIAHISYMDLVCDKKSVDGYRIVKEEMVVTKDQIAENTPGEQKKKEQNPQNATSEKNVFFNNIRYAFRDTKNKWATFSIEAESRFKKYFPEDQDHGFSINGYCHDKEKLDRLYEAYLKEEQENNNAKEAIQIKSTDKNALVEHLKKTLPVLSTEPPKIPSIEKIVPIIHWDEQDKTDTSVTVKRHCNRFRVYFKDWYDTRFDEKVAVLFLQEEKRSPFNSSNTLRIDKDDLTEKSVSQVITQFGKDPTAQSNNGINPHIITEGDFLEARRPILTIDISNFGALPEPGLFPGAEGLDLKLSAAIYDIKFKNVMELKKGLPEEQQERVTEGKFYVDIVLDEKYLLPHYFPFVRFAIARYQPNSLMGKEGDADCFKNCFSPIVLTDFCQPLPYREVAISWTESEVTATFDAKSSVFRRNRNGGITNIFQMSGNMPALEAGLQPKQFGYGLFQRSKSENSSKQKAENGGQLTLERSGDTDAIIISEYEDYQSPEQGKFPADPRSDFSKRLVFAYQLNLKPFQNASTKESK